MACDHRQRHEGMEHRPRMREFAHSSIYLTILNIETLNALMTGHAYLCKQGLAATRRPVEEHTLRWGHAELFKLLGVLNRVLDKFLR